MKTTISTLGAIRGTRRGMPAAIALGFLWILAAAPVGLAQTDPPLNFGNNYFVTGDYVVAGVGLRGLGVNGYAPGTITMPDPNTVPATGVPPGAAVVAAFLYWQTVESSSTAFAGQTGYFWPNIPGVPSTGYPITGAILGNPNSPVAWSSGGCSGSSQGTKTIRTYRANVLPLLPVDAQGNVLAGNSSQPVTYNVRLADSGSNGGGAPLTLGATLVIIYRVLDPNVPLNSIVIYDGAFAPSNSSSTFAQTMQGFYQAGTPVGSSAPISKLTQIVGNGQDNKYESVSFNSVSLPSLYGNLPPFPGYYNSNGSTFDGSWDNPTWIVNNYPPLGTAMLPDASSAITNVMPSASNSGCVSWGAVIVSTTVQDSDGDGLLDYWEDPPGPNNPVNNQTGPGTVNPQGDPGYVDVGTGQFVDLHGADPAKKDIFVEMDYLCSDAIVNADGTSTSCDTTYPNYSFQPSTDAQNKMIAAFAAKNINLHLIPMNAIQETTCTDDLSADPKVFCQFPDQPGVVGWKAGFEYLKYQPMNYPDELSCEEAPSTDPCIRRFQHGKKDSYHYALFGHALGVANWSLLGGNLTSVSESGNTVTFTTTTDPSYNATTNPAGLVVDSVSGNGRVTVSDVISNLCLDGTFNVSGVTSSSFTIQVPANTLCPANATYTLASDPALAVTSGQAGTGSGFSDFGGEDTLVTLGLWGADGQTTNVQAGTFMHELGHTLGLSHGGVYYDAGSQTPILGANCKANYQSVMSYLFQVDLLDNGVLDYSEQKLGPIDESASGTGLTPTPTYYSTTKWYTATQPYGVGTPAKYHCDGTPIITTGPNADFNPTMYRVEGLTSSVKWNDQDTNFNGKIDSNLRGYNDWANIDLRQIGATGSLGLGGGQFALGGGQFGLGGGQFGLGGGQFGLGGGQFGLGGGQFGLGGGQFGLGGGQFALGGEGNGEVTHEQANSVTRPPRNLTATMQKSPSAIVLKWRAPTFGRILAYNIYRGTNALPAAPPYATVSTGTPPPDSPDSTYSFTDSKISCGATYNYFVTAVLAGTNPPQESVPSNLVTVVKCTVP
jgi:hypothetical protein